MTDCEHNLVNARIIECHKCASSLVQRIGYAIGYPWAHEFYGKHAGHAMRITCECGHVEEIGGETAPVRDPGHMLQEKPKRWDFSKHPQCVGCLNTGWDAGHVGTPCLRCHFGDERAKVIVRGPAEGT